MGIYARYHAAQRLELLPKIAEALRGPVEEIHRRLVAEGWVPWVPKWYVGSPGDWVQDELTRATAQADGGWTPPIVAYARGEETVWPRDEVERLLEPLLPAAEETDERYERLMGAAALVSLEAGHDVG